jgi:hypothetical protein
MQLSRAPETSADSVAALSLCATRNSGPSRWDDVAVRLQLFEDDVSGTAVLLMHGDDPNDASAIRRTVDDLAAGRLETVAVEGLPGFEAIGGCSLTLTVGDSDQGLELVGPAKRSFRCGLRPASWETVSGLLEPFEAPLSGHRHQYLAGSDPVMWIVSTDAEW